VIHYCQNYRQGDWLFAKRRVPKGAALTWPPATNSILHCTHPLLAEPPQNLSRVLSYATNDGGTKPLRPREAARVNFVLRTATHGVNAALARFKMDVCLSKSNVKENTLRSHLSSSRSSDSGGGRGQIRRNEMNLARSYRLVPEYVERQAEREAKKKAQAAAKANGSQRA